MCFQLEKLMKEHEDKLTAADKDAVGSGDRARSATRPRATTPTAIKAAIARARAGFARLQQDALRQGRPPAGAGAGRPATAPARRAGQPGGGEDEPIDAEFEVKNSGRSADACA